MEVRPLDAGIPDAAYAWFDDAKTQRWLGDRAWLTQELEACRLLPDRYGWFAYQEDDVVGYCGVEVGEGSGAPVSRPVGSDVAWCLVVVDPLRRGRGFARAILDSVAARAELAGAREMWGGIHPANSASLRAAARAGFEVTDVTDGDGMLYVRKRISRPDA